jgi:hypothetical protein
MIWTVGLFEVRAPFGSTSLHFPSIYIHPSIMLEKARGAMLSEAIEPVVSFKPSKAAVLVDKNSRTIVKILQLQEHLSDAEKNSTEKTYSDKDKAILRKICMIFSVNI